MSASLEVSTAAASSANPQSATYFSKQWGLTQIDAPAAWQYGTGSGVRIGIVDTGVDLDHPDLAGKVVAAATCLNTGGDPSQCVTSPGSGEDDNGHGTHVAGIAAASGIGVAGVAPGASLVVAKVLNSSGDGSTSDVAAGIEWVVHHGAKVVNLSLGPETGLLGVDCAVGAVGGCGSSTITDAVEAAWNAGAIPVIAAGNNAGNLFGPQGYGDLDAIVVAATGPDGQFAADYSSTPGNAKWGVLAPGGDDPNGSTTPTCGVFDPTEILSTYWSNGTSCYATDEGTSMATPFVSGTLALMLGRGLSQQQAVQTLLSTLNKSVTCGSGQGCLGLVDAGAAMAAASRIAPAPSAKAGSSSAPSGSSSAQRSDDVAAAAPTSSPIRGDSTVGTGLSSGSQPGTTRGSDDSGSAARQQPPGPGSQAAGSSRHAAGSGVSLPLLIALGALLLLATILWARWYERARRHV